MGWAKGTLRFSKSDQAALAWAKDHPADVADVLKRRDNNEALRKLRSTDDRFFSKAATHYVESHQTKGDLGSRWERLLAQNSIPTEQIPLITGEELPVETAPPATVETPAEESTTVESSEEDAEEPDWDILRAETLHEYLNEHPKVKNHVRLLIYQDELLLNDTIAQQFVDLGVPNAKAFLDTVITAHEQKALPEDCYQAPPEAEPPKKSKKPKKKAEKAKRHVANIIHDLHHAKDIEQLSFKELQAVCDHYSLKVDRKNSVAMIGALAQELFPAEVITEEIEETIVSDRSVSEPTEAPAAPTDLSGPDRSVRPDLQAINHFDFPPPTSRLLSLDQVVIPDWNPRRNADFEDLYQALKGGAKLEPIKVFTYQGQELVIDGSRRVNALRKFGASEVDALVFEMDLDMAIDYAGIWNFAESRRNLPDLDAAHFLAARKAAHGYKNAQLAAKYFPGLNNGAGEKRVSRLLKLIELPEPVQALMEIPRDPEKNRRPLAPSVAYDFIASLVNPKETPPIDGIPDDQWAAFIRQTQLLLATRYTRSVPTKTIEVQVQRVRQQCIDTNQAILSDVKFVEDTVVATTNEIKLRRTFFSDFKDISKPETKKGGLLSPDGFVTAEYLEAILERKGGQLVKQRRKASKKDAQLQEYETQEDELTQTLAVKDAEYHDLCDQIRDLIAQRQQVETTRHKVREQLAELERERKDYLATGSEEIRVIDQEVRALKADIAKWQDDLATCEAKRDAIQAFHAEFGVVLKRDPVGLAKTVLRGQLFTLMTKPADSAG